MLLSYNTRNANKRLNRYYFALSELYYEYLGIHEPRKPLIFIQIKAWRACSIICVCVCVFVCARVFVCVRAWVPMGACPKISHCLPSLTMLTHNRDQPGSTVWGPTGYNQVQLIPTMAKQGQLGLTGANWLQLTQIRANQGSTGTNQGQPCQLGPTEGNRGQLGPTGPNRVQPGPTGSNWIQLGLTRPNQGHMRPTRAIKAFQTPSVHFQDTLLILSRHHPNTIQTPSRQQEYSRHISDTLQIPNKTSRHAK